MINENFQHPTLKRSAFRGGVLAWKSRFDLHGVRGVPLRLKPRLHTLAIILSPSRAVAAWFEREPLLFADLSILSSVFHFPRIQRITRINGFMRLKFIYGG
jgi:hypothetical protein